MHPMPHASFEARWEQHPSPEAHPPGKTLAHELEAALRERFTLLGGPEIWRDCGWSIDIQGEEEGPDLQVYFAPYTSETRCLLAVAPLNPAGWLARLLGRGGAPVRAETLQRVCAVVRAVLCKEAQLRHIEWMLGGPPGKVPQVASPAELAWPQGR